MKHKIVLEDTPTKHCTLSWAIWTNFRRRFSTIYFNVILPFTNYLEWCLLCGISYNISSVKCMSKWNFCIL